MRAINISSVLSWLFNLYSLFLCVGKNTVRLVSTETSIPSIYEINRISKETVYLLIMQRDIIDGKK